MGESRSRRTAGSLAFVLLLTCLATGLFLPTAARASCVGPMLVAGPAGTSPTAFVPGGSTESARPVAAAPGEGLALAGQFFLDGCNDVIACSGGCAGCRDADPAEPISGLQIFLVTNAGETQLGEVDAGEQGAWRLEVTLPSDAPPGAATVEARWPLAREGQQVLATAEVTLT